MRKSPLLLLLFVIIAAGLTVGLAAAAPGGQFPDTIALPDGFQPEGVATGRGPEIFAGSLVDGAIYRADLRTGAREILIEGGQGIAVGLSYDARSGYLFVAGGPLGTGKVYDVASGQLVQQFQLSNSYSFINDVVVTRDAAYFTNSFQPEFYRVPLDPAGELAGAAETIALQGPAAHDPVQPPDFIVFSNGIVASSDGAYLVIVNSNDAALYRVDPHTGDSLAIDLGGQAVPNGDGLVLIGETLYVVQNFINQISVVELSDEFDAGWISKMITDPDFDIPTTAAAFGSRLYAVNARFSTPPTDTTTYDIIQVQR
jgi:sugar lactone lactonase YvrE